MFVCDIKSIPIDRARVMSSLYHFLDTAGDGNPGDVGQRRERLPTSRYTVTTRVILRYYGHGIGPLLCVGKAIRHAVLVNYSFPFEEKGKLTDAESKRLSPCSDSHQAKSAEDKRFTK